MDQHVINGQLVHPARRAEEGPSFARCRSASIFFFLSLAVAGLAGCSRDGHQGAAASSNPGSSSPLSMIRSAAVVPNPVVRHMPLKVVLDADEAHERAFTYQYQWFVNRIAVQGATTASFDPSSLHRGDVVHAEILMANEKGDRASLQTPAVTVMNALPAVQNVVLEHDMTRRRLVAKVEASDQDQDDVRYVFRWLRNDKVVSEGAESAFDAAGLAENDVVTVEVTPHDGDGAGASVRAKPMVAGNNAPNIVSHPLVMGNPESYEYAVVAKDPEGDPVFFELEKGPTGMAIDRASGRVSWKVAPTLTGTHHVKIVAVDGKGARSWQEFDLSIPAALSKAESPTAS